MKLQNRGKLIVIEGLDGSGKATQSQLLLERLLNDGFDSKKISFPDYGEPSSALLKMYLNADLGSSPNDINAYAASSFFAVDRIVNYVKFWKEFYNSGGVVVADRYTTSNAVYHMSKLPYNEWDEYLEWLQDFEYCKMELPKPDVVIYLHMPIEISQSLIEKRYNGDNSKKDIHEKNVEFLTTCRKAAEYSIEKLGWKKIFCNCFENVRDIKSISDEVFLASVEAIKSDF